MFRGDSAAAIQRLQAEGGEESPAESLFLLALANDELGLARPEEARRYEEQLLAAYPESTFARAIQIGRRRAELRTRLGQQPAPGGRAPSEVAGGPTAATAAEGIHSLLADYDVDGDEALDATELEMIRELEPRRLAAFRRAMGPAADTDAAGMLRQFDRNRDGRLGTNELTGMLGSPGGRGAARPGPMPSQQPRTNGFPTLR